MNKSSFLGFIIIGAIQYLVVYQSSKSPAIFLDVNALLLVFGGTVAASLVAFPFSSLTRTFDFLMWGLIFKKKNQFLKVSQDVAGARGAFLVNQSYLTNDESHPFLRESVLFLLNKNIDNKAFEDILKKRSEYFRKRYIDDATLLRSLSKYPMAFGFLGAVTKVIEIFQLGQNTSSVAISEAVAVALVSVFWGLGFANFIILPLADSALKAADEDHLLRNLIADGMNLIRKKATDDHFQAYLRGYLNLSDRNELKIYSGKNVIPLPVPPKIEVSAEVNEPVSLFKTEIQAATAVIESSENETVIKPSATGPSENLKVAEEPPATDEKTKIRLKKGSVMESPGRVEQPVEINQNAMANEGDFNFKTLRQELKKSKKA